MDNFAHRSDVINELCFVQNNLLYLQNGGPNQFFKNVTDFQQMVSIKSYIISLNNALCFLNGPFPASFSLSSSFQYK